MSCPGGEVCPGYEEAVAHLTPFMEAEKASLAAAGQVVKRREKSCSQRSRVSSRHCKNIVGVVLACNNYEVIDWDDGACEKILERARVENADMIASAA